MQKQELTSLSDTGVESVLHWNSHVIKTRLMLFWILQWSKLSLITDINIFSKLITLQISHCTKLNIMFVPVSRFSHLEFNIQIWLSGVNHVNNWRLSSVSTNISVPIFGVGVCGGDFRSPYIYRAMFFIMSLLLVSKVLSLLVVLVTWLLNCL
jgi:hypothetical protein